MNQSFIDKTSIFQTRPKYSNEGKEILQFFENKKIGQSLKPVVVTPMILRRENQFFYQVMVIQK